MLVPAEEELIADDCGRSVDRIVERVGREDLKFFDRVVACLITAVVPLRPTRYTRPSAATGEA